MGEINLPGILVLEVFQAAARGAVAQASPFGVGHLLQRLGFPEESLLARGRLGGCGHEVRRFPDRVRSPPSRRSGASGASGADYGAIKAGRALGLTIKMVSQTIGLWPPLG